MTNTMKYTTEVQEVSLEKLKFEVRKVLGRSQASVDLELNIRHAEMLDALVYDLTTTVLAEEVGRVSRGIEYPDGWFQMLKDECFPMWLKSRFPVRMRKRSWTIRKMATYPKLEKVFDTERPVIKYLVEEKPEK